MKKQHTKKRRVRAPRRQPSFALTPAFDRALKKFRAEVRALNEGLCFDYPFEHDRNCSIYEHLENISHAADILSSAFYCDYL